MEAGASRVSGVNEETLCQLRDHGWRSEQPALVEGVSAHGRRLEWDEL